MAKKSDAPTDRVRLRRMHERGDYGFETIAEILDAQLMCTFAYCVDGKPTIVPTFQWREGDRVYWHGSSASRALKASKGMEVCLNVNVLDGLVLARSAMHHSANFRSVTVFGVAEVVPDEKKDAVLEAFMERLVPGRWETLRPMNDQERKATLVLSMPLTEASAKVRAGGPSDDEEDYALPIWAGVVPVKTVSSSLIPDERNLTNLAVPDYLKDFTYQP